MIFLEITVVTLDTLGSSSAKKSSKTNHELLVNFLFRIKSVSVVKICFYYYYNFFFNRKESYNFLLKC